MRKSDASSCSILRALRRAAVLVVAAFALNAPSAQAAYTTLALPTLNADVRTFTDGSTYTPFFPGNWTFNDVPFVLAEDAATGNTIWQVNQDGDALIIPVDVFGVRSAYTLINSAFGILDALNGTVTFNGSGGLSYSVNLVQGINIRDHFVGFYNNVIDGTTARTIPDFPQGPDTAHLDQQIYILPDAFASATLESIVLTGSVSSYVDIDTGETILNFPEGLAFIAAATVSTELPGVPEPSTYLLLLAGLGALGWSARRRSA